MKINAPGDDSTTDSSPQHPTGLPPANTLTKNQTLGAARDETASPSADGLPGAKRARGKVLRLRPSDMAAEAASTFGTRTVLRSESSALPKSEPRRSGKLTHDFTDEWCMAQPPAPQRKRVVVWDGREGTETAELSFRVTDTGAKSWTIEKWVNGRSWKWSLGVFDRNSRDHLDVVTARRKARRALDELAEGKDPRDEERKRIEAAKLADEKKRGVRTVGRLLDDFIARKDRHNAGDAYRQEQRRQFETMILPEWKNVPVDEIGAGDVRALLAPIAKRAPFSANRCFATIRKFFTWGLNQGHVKTHPVFGLEPPGGAEESRTRVLTDKELRAVWDAADALGFPFSDVVRMAILTGQRRNEITGMRWSDLDWKSKTWVIPKTKAKTPHAVPLAPMALRLLKTIKNEKRVDENDDGLVFCFHVGVHLSPWGHAISALRKATAIDFRGHDLRRTMRTGLSRLGVTSDVAERVIGHVIGGVRGVYDLHTFTDEKRDALGRWEKHVAKILRAKT